MRGLLKTYYQKNSGLYSATHQRYKDDDKQGKGSIFSPDNHAKYERRNSQDLADVDRPKTKEELKHEKIKERERIRVARAADRREQWISMNVNDPDFIQGFQQGALPLYHSDNLRFRDFSAPGKSGFTGSTIKSSIEKSGMGKIPTYDHTDYDPKQPSNHNNFRPRDLNKETTSPMMKYTFKDEKERIQDKISNIPKLSTEPLNTLLLIKPKWREHDESKWVGGKEFQSMMSKKDQAWQPMSNIRQDYPEPFIENKVQFRNTASVMSKMPVVALSGNKRRNLSQIRTTVNNSNQVSAFKATPKGSRSGSREKYDESPVHKFGHEQMFDSTVPRDKTWQNRVVQSISLRQKHHLNQSLKIRKNLHHKDSANNFDIREHIEAEKHRSKSPEHDEVDSDKEQDSDRKHLTLPGGHSSPLKKDDPPSNKPLSPITQEFSATPGGRQNFLNTSTQKKPPLPKKEQLITLDKLAPDLAAGYLNNEFTNSYTNAWQYNLTVKAPQTYFNKKFEEKEELRESHILWELDREKTYYRSALERLNPQQVRNQVEAEKLRRTNMQMSLNQNVMDKAPILNDAQSAKFSNSLKKLPSVLSKPKSPFKEGAFHQIATIHERTGSGFYNSSAASTNNGNPGGMSPLKLMSMTMPKGFVSPKNGKKGGAHEMNKSEIKEVVKSYFDKAPPTQQTNAQQNVTPVPPTSAGAYSMTNEFVIQVGAFTASPQKI